MKNRFSVNQNLRKASSSKFLLSHLKKLGKNNSLFSHKSFLEVLLGLIKDSQNEYLSVKDDTNNNSTKHKNKISVKSAKDLLLSLKNNLSSIHKEKVNELKTIKKENRDEKSCLCRFKKNNSIFKEIKQLKDMNFQYENEIKKMDNLIQSHDNYLFLVTSYNCFFEIFSENYVKSTKEYENVDKIYEEILENIKTNLREIENKLILKEKNISFFQEEISHLENIFEKNENIFFNEDVITENSKEYINSNNIEENSENKPNNKKKVNFTININEDNKDKGINDFLLKDGISLKSGDKYKFNNKKNLSKEKFQKQRFSYPQIRNVNNSRNNLSQIFLKKNNNYFSNFFNINKSTNDFDRTTISSINDKTIESEKLMNNTI